LWPNGVKILLALGLGERLRQIGHSLFRQASATPLRVHVQKNTMTLADPPFAGWPGARMGNG
jgi:hypothetical protein